MAEYDPPEAKIAEVLDRTGGDMRTLAVAYLRAQKRARDAELAFRVMADIQDMTMAAASGDKNSVRESMEKAKRRLTQHRDISSS